MEARAPDRPGHIEPIAILPVFFKLGGRRALVAGGSPSAAWKAELLAAAGADVRVASAEPCDAMVELVQALPDRLTMLRRDWTPADLNGVAVAIGAFEGDEGSRFREAAHQAGVPVNVIDVPSLCDFQFGTVVARSPLVIGISTDGAAPVLGQALRTRIEALLPPAMGLWARAATDWRADLQARKLGFAARRRFWERFADMALEGGTRPPSEEDRQICLAAAMAEGEKPLGRLILVGAGPGAPELVTLQAVRALQSADVILYNERVDPAILGMGRREARRVREDNIAREIAVASAGEGQTVAWIAPGDPQDCNAWGERIASLDRSAVAVEIVRGLRCATCPQGCAAPPDQGSGRSVRVPP